MVSHRILSGNSENVAHFPFSQILFRLALNFAEFPSLSPTLSSVWSMSGPFQFSTFGFLYGLFSVWHLFRLEPGAVQRDNDR